MKRLMLIMVIAMISIPSSGQVYYGLFESALPSNNTRLTDIENELGKKPGMVVMFTTLGNTLDVAGCNNLISRGITPVITLEPGVSYASINDGTNDTKLRAFADQLLQINGTVFLRYAHEMNGNWYTWDGYHNGANAAAATAYITAWRHVYGIIKTEKGANNVLWNWCVNNGSWPSPTLDGATWNEHMDYYPGDAYVDWLGFDSYDKPYNHTPTKYQSVDDIVGPVYAILTAGVPDKPILIGEIASENYQHETDPHKADFFSQGGNLFDKYPRIHGFAYFNVAKSNSGRWNDYRYSNPTTLIPIFKDNWISNVNVVNGNAGIATLHMHKVVPQTGTLKIEAENYFDQFGMKNEVCTEGGLDAGYAAAGDYMDYLINVSANGTYSCNLRVASNGTTGKIEIRNQTGTPLATYAQTSSTGGWQIYESHAVNINLTAGKQKLRIYFSGAGINVNWFELSKIANNAPVVSFTSPTAGAAFETGANVQITVLASDADGTISKVEFYDGMATTPFQTENLAPYDFIWSTFSVGAHTITAKAFDNAGAITTATRSITVTSSSDPLSLSYFHIVDKFTSDYMRPSGGSPTATIIQEESAAVPTLSSFQWEFRAAPASGYYHIVNRYTGNAIQPTGASTVDNTGLSQVALTTSNASNTELQWAIQTSDESPYYWIKNRKSGLYIRPNGGTNGTGVAIVQNTLNATYSSFKWTFVNQGTKTARSANEIVAGGGTTPTVIYPNPVADIITVITEVKIQSDVSISIYNMAGKQFLSKDFQNVQGRFEKNFDISGYPSGEFVFKIKKGDAVESSKVIKK